jgi:Family of unknown function (DUF5995)
MHPVVGALVGRMAELLQDLEGRRDPARFFLGTYLRTTRAVGEALDVGTFEDPDWVARWDVDFAALYLDALEVQRTAPGSVAAPWRLAFGAKPGLPPEAHVLLGMNAHINYDLPQSLVRMIPPAEFASRSVLALRHRDHERIDDVLAVQVGTEDAALERAGGRRTPVDRLLSPLNHRASRLFLRESRRKVWANAEALHRARLRGPADYAVCLADLEAASADRVTDLLRPGPVLLRLAVHGFGVTIPAI